MGRQWPRDILGMELDADKERMVLQLDRLDDLAVGRSTGDDQA